MRPINVRVPAEDYLQLKSISEDTGVTVSEVAREAIARYLGRAGAGQRTRARLDRMEEQINRLLKLLGQK